MENILRKNLENSDHEKINDQIKFSSPEKLSGEYEILREKLGDDADNNFECEKLRLEAQIAKSELDRAGVFKFKSFIRREREFFRDDHEGLSLVKNEKEQGIRVLPEMENRRFLFVSMGELARLNKEGHSHSAGDTALSAVANAIRIAASEQHHDFSVYRFGGNEYMVEFPNITEEEILKIEDSILAEELDLGDYKNLDAPPLISSRVDMTEVVDIVNTVYERDALSSTHDEFEKSIESVNVLRRLAEFSLEMEKFSMSINRVIEKLEEVKLGKIRRGDVKSFFDTYHKKVFYGTSIDSLEAIEEIWRDGTDPEDFKRTVDLMSAESVRAKFANDRNADLYLDHVVVGVTREYLRVTNLNEKNELDFLQNEENKKLARIPSAVAGTQGLRVLHSKKKQIGSRGGAWREVDELDYQAEVLKRDTITGLPERGQFFEDLEKEVKEENEVSMIFIDLGYLKYFNEAGRVYVAEAALLKAAEIMEQALMENEINGSVYRFGGDEFTVLINGGRKEAETIKNEIERIRSEAGCIPDLRSLREAGHAVGSLGDSRADYAPRELIFNYGISTIEDATRVVNDIGDENINELLGGKFRSKEGLKMDLLVKLSDTAVNYDKAVSRFHELLDLMSDPEYVKPDSLGHMRIESIISASRKAIFESLGGEAALRFWAEGRKNESAEVLDKQIERFVADRTEKMSEIVMSEKELVDKLVEVHAVRNRLLAEVHRLQKQLANEKYLKGKLDSQIGMLRSRVTEAEKAREEIINTRLKIGSGGVDKMA